MERLDEDGQWIVLMGFLVSVGIFALAIVISQGGLVGQTTAEAVLEFPKTEIQDLRSEVEYWGGQDTYDSEVWEDVQAIALQRHNAVVRVSVAEDSVNKSGSVYRIMKIHFNNGVTVYDENMQVPRRK